MDALLLALVLTLVLDQGAGTQRDIARLGNGGAVDTRTICSLAFMVLANAVIAATLGGTMAMVLLPDARMLFLAIALSMGGLGLLFASFRKPPLPDASSGHTSLRRMLTLTLRRAGENGAFATAGIAAFTDAPVLAAIGATVGGWAALAPPLTLGGRYGRHWTLPLFQLVSGGLLLYAAMGCAVNALRMT